MTSLLRFLVALPAVSLPLACGGNVVVDGSAPAGAGGASSTSTGGQGGAFAEGGAAFPSLTLCSKPDVDMANECSGELLASVSPTACAGLAACETACFSDVSSCADIMAAVSGAMNAFAMCIRSC